MHSATCALGSTNGIQHARGHARNNALPVLVAARQASCTADDGRLWYCLILMADSARANGKLIRSLCSQASECPSLMFLAQRCDAHQAHKLVEVAAESFDLLNARYAAVHLLMLA